MNIPSHYFAMKMLSNASNIEFFQLFLTVLFLNAISGLQNCNVNGALIRILMEKRWMDDLQLMSLSTLIQSYQNDRKVIMQDCVQWNTVHE